MNMSINLLKETKYNKYLVSLQLGAEAGGGRRTILKPFSLELLDSLVIRPHNGVEFLIGLIAQISCLLVFIISPMGPFPYLAGSLRFHSLHLGTTRCSMYLGPCVTPIFSLVEVNQAILA